MILFTADYHLKLGQKNVPVSWSKSRFNMLFDQLDKLYDRVEAHIIGGDTFDRVPTLDELSLFFSLVERCKVPTYIYDGNHEAVKKGETFLTVLSNIVQRINPLVKIVTDVTEIEYGTILPYCKLKTKGILTELNPNKPLFTHVRGEIPPHVKAEVSLEDLARFNIVFAGDLHSHSNSQRNIVYPGSPLTTSFHRSRVDTGYLLISTSDCNWEWKPFNLPQLIRKTVSSESEMIATDFDHTIYELEGGLADLASVKDSELLDKKIIKRSRESALILNRDMTIEEELTEYLTYILELKDAEIKDLIGVFRDYTKKT